MRVPLFPLDVNLFSLNYRRSTSIDPIRGGEPDKMFFPNGQSDGAGLEWEFP